MNKSDLIAAVESAAGSNPATAKRHVEAFLDVIEAALVRGEKVTIPGFGNFEVRERSARQARNPQTGETIQVAASRAPAFKPGRPLKDKVNKG